MAIRHSRLLLRLLPWLMVVAFYLGAPNYLSLGTNVLIMILFALSLEIALGYAGIVSLGHAAFYGGAAMPVADVSGIADVGVSPVP